jgi:hypothetical protein
VFFQKILIPSNGPSELFAGPCDSLICMAEGCSFMDPTCSRKSWASSSIVGALLADEKQLVFAKFKRGDQLDMMSSFLISTDREKVLKWTGAKEEREAPRDESLADSPDPQSGDGFQTLTQDFLKAIEVYHRLIPTLTAFTPIVRLTGVHGNLYELVKTEGTLLDKDDKYELFQFNKDLLVQIDRALETIRATSRGWNSLPYMLLMGLVSSYDAFLAQLIRLIFVTKPETLSSSERNISFRDLVCLSSVEAAREMMIEKEVEAVIRKKSSRSDYLVGKQIGADAHNRVESVAELY